MALAPQQFCVRWNSYHSNLQTVFPKLLSTENFADVTLACESRQLRCHKVVLSACSAYFERLLVQNPCKHPIIFMKDMRFSEMQSLVDFMYKGEVNVTQDDLPSLLKSAEALQIRGLCSSEAGGAGCEGEAEAAASAKGTQTGDGRDFTLATEALLAHAQLDCSPAGNGAARPSDRTNGPTASRKRPSPTERTGQHELKEERVEEDGLYYGEMDSEQMDFNEDEESGKAGGSLDQPSASHFIRVKPESKLLQKQKTDEYLNRLSQMTPYEIQTEFAKYGFNTEKIQEDDYYKAWLEQNGELEVSLLKANGRKGDRTKDAEVQRKSLLEKTLRNEQNAYQPKPEPVKRRGRPPLKDKPVASSMLKTDLDQFLEGKEVSSSGLSRRELERVMMGKFNPNRRYSNEAMWAALMDVKRGGSIYRAAQTHKVPRKSLRNWMKRCHIKSSFPMPQQLKQFVENNRRQRQGSPGSNMLPETDAPLGSDMTHKEPPFGLNVTHGSNLTRGPNMTQTWKNALESQSRALNVAGLDYTQNMKQAHFEQEMNFGKHFLALAGSNAESSDEDANDVREKTKDGTGEGASKRVDPSA